MPGQSQGSFVGGQELIKDKRERFSSWLYSMMHSQPGHRMMHGAQASFTRGGQKGPAWFLGLPLNLSDKMYGGSGEACEERRRLAEGAVNRQLGGKALRRALMSNTGRLAMTGGVIFAGWEVLSVILVGLLKIGAVGIAGTAGVGISLSGVGIAVAIAAAVVAVGYAARKYSDGAFDKVIEARAVSAAELTTQYYATFLVKSLFNKVFVTFSTVYVTKYAQIVQEKVTSLLSDIDDVLSRLAILTPDQEKAAKQLIIKLNRAIHSPALDSAKKDQVTQLVVTLQQGVVKSKVNELATTLEALNSAEAEQIPQTLEGARFQNVRHRNRKEAKTNELEDKVAEQVQKLSKFMREQGMSRSSIQSNFSEVIDDSVAVAQRRENTRKRFHSGPVDDLKSNRFGAGRDIAFLSEKSFNLSPAAGSPEGIDAPGAEDSGECSTLPDAADIPPEARTASPGCPATLSSSATGGLGMWTQPAAPEVTTNRVASPTRMPSLTT